MIAAVSPADYNFDETLSTLKYANRAKSIENAVKRNEDQNDRMIKDLKQEIERLKQQLEQGGGGGTVADPEVAKKLVEMEEAQKNAWDEKERLSRALEEERQANMNTVITQMMQGVKEQKVNHMKNIKKLTMEKTSLNDKFKQLKDVNGTLKGTLDGTIKRYQQLQAQYDKVTAAVAANAAEEGAAKTSLDEVTYATVKRKTDLIAKESSEKAEKIATEMAELLTKIETNRSTWMANRETLKTTKDRLGAVDEEITDERAELVATAGLLDQNDKLRAQIQAEEREKMSVLMEEEIAQQRQKMEQEFAAVRGANHTLTPSHPHTLTPSHLHILTPSHSHTLTPSHPHTLTPSHPHTLTPSHPHTLTPSHPHTLTPSHTPHRLMHLPPNPLTPRPPHTMSRPLHLSTHAHTRTHTRTRTRSHLSPHH